LGLLSHCSEFSVASPLSAPILEGAKISADHMECQEILRSSFSCMWL
jgi:hypothetical protein